MPSEKILSIFQTAFYYLTSANLRNEAANNQSHTEGTTAQASQVIGGGQVSLMADEGRLNITGSDVAGKEGTLLRAQDIVLQSAGQHHSERSDNRSSDWNAGVAVSYGQNGLAFGFTGGGNYGKGYGNGDDVTHRHSRIGDADGPTVIQSSGDTTLKGAQVSGKGIALTARNLNIESVQDSAVYRGRQQNISGSVTVGYGASASADYNRSKTNADHLSVTEQSGIFAGDDGFQVNVSNHTDLKGGIITSSEAAEQNGRNRFQTVTLTQSDIRNHSRYEGDSFGINISGSISGETLGQKQNSRLQTVAGKNSIGSTIGYGRDGDSQSSATRSGIGTRNIVIANDTTGEQAAAVYTDTRSETAEQNSGRLNNAFDKDRVQKELDIQREVTQQFGQNAAQGVAQLSDYLGNTQDFQRAEMLKSAIESELAATQDGQRRENLQQTLNQVDGYLETNRGRYETWKEGGVGRSILHGAVGGLTTGNLDGVLGAGGASAAAPYFEKAAENLNPTGKAVVDALGGAAVGYMLGGNAGAVTGANADWNNRQLHPSERQLIKKHAEAMQTHVKKAEGKDISLAEAELRLEKQILRWIDKASDDGYTDQTAVSVLGISGKSGDTRWDYRDYANRYPSAYANTNLFAEYLDPNRKTQLQNLRSGKPTAQIQAGERKNEELAMELVGNVPVGKFAKPAVANWFDWLKGGKPYSGTYAADPVLVGANGVHIPTTVGNKGNIPDNVSASVGNKNQSTQSTGSSIPVPEPVKITLKDGTTLMYQSNPKHTPGQPGFKPDAGIEPRNSATLLTNSVEIGKQRFAFDNNGHIHRYMGGERGGQWHWAGSTADVNNPLALTGQQKSKLRSAFPEQKKNRLLR